MKLSAFMLGAISAAAIGGAASAQVFGAVDLAYIHAPDNSYDYQLNGGGSLGYAINNRWSFQADLGLMRDGNGYDAAEIDVHAIYSLSPSLDLGLVYATTNYDWNGFDEAGIGIEALYRTGNLSLEAFWMQYLGSDSEYSDIGLEVGYSLSTISSAFAATTIYGGFVLEYQSGSLDRDNLYVGALFDVGNGYKVDTRYASMDEGNYHYITIGLVKEFGGGATFGRRGYGSVFPGN